MKIAEIVLFVAIAAIPMLIAAGALLLRQEWRRRGEADGDKAARAAAERLARMATVTGDIGRPPSVIGSPLADVRGPAAQPDRWEEGGQVLAELDPGLARTFDAGRPGGQQWAVERRPRPPAHRDLEARLRAAEGEIDRLRIENARLRSELSLCPAPSEVARTIRDHGPIGTVEIARRLGTTTAQVDREAQSLSAPQGGNPPLLSTLWPEVVDGIDPDALRFPDPDDRPLWVWSAHIDDLDLGDVAGSADLGVTDWALLERMVDELAPARIGAGR